MVEQTLFSIRDVNARVRAIVERETIGKPFWMEGSVRKHYVSDLKHQYFELYDSDNFAIRCMVLDAVAAELSFSIVNGLDLEVFGTIRVYEKRASLEFEVEEAKWVESVLPRLNEDVKVRLENENLWPKPQHVLPGTIVRIGLITSTRSEALEDFRQNYYEQGGKAEINPQYARVQGQHAPREIAEAIEWFNRQQTDPVDVIVLTRGGGRAVDLAVFSDYLIAEAICKSEIPVMTGIGHESNETFADLAADVSKGTPTAIAVCLAQWGKEPDSDQQQAPSQPAKPEIASEFADSRWMKYVLGVVGIGIAVGIIAGIILLVLVLS